MVELKGKYNTAIVFTDNIDSGAIAQVTELLNQDFTKGNKICIMPDCHKGAGCVIGTTMTIKDKIVPNLVGVDISCGMLTVELGKIDIELTVLDSYINNYIPSGFNIRDEELHYSELDKLACRDFVNLNRAKRSIGTLGGGNHFIELSKDSKDNLYLVIHSGSRHLGKQVAELYQEKAHNELKNKKGQIDELIQQLKAEGRESEISGAIKTIPKSRVPKYLCYVEGTMFDNYLHDMDILDKYARLNREFMAKEICKSFGRVLEDTYFFHTVHNYIDTDSMILRKGAISARTNEKILIPMNMRDGSLLCRGKGNPNWNYSAPHGAGRIMSRNQAKEMLNMDEFQSEMNGIHSTSILKSTLDEAPMAYKPMEEIINNIEDTAEIIDIIKPIYNFKAH